MKKIAFGRLSNLLNETSEALYVNKTEHYK
jgi:hypothetical protein